MAAVDESTSELALLGTGLPVGVPVGVEWGLWWGVCRNCFSSARSKLI